MLLTLFNWIFVFVFVLGIIDCSMPYIFILIDFGENDHGVSENSNFHLGWRIVQVRSRINKAVSLLPTVRNHNQKLLYLSSKAISIFYNLHHDSSCLSPWHLFLMFYNFTATYTICVSLVCTVQWARFKSSKRWEGHFWRSDARIELVLRLLPT